MRNSQNHQKIEILCDNILVHCKEGQKLLSTLSGIYLTLTLSGIYLTLSDNLK